MRKYLALAGLALLVACGAYTLTTEEAMRTQLGARDYADREGGKFLSCSGQDSDGDKYVTCTVQDKSGADKALLCSYASQGCKPK